jgi:hypothetical protein
MLLISDLNFDPIAELLGKFELVLELVADEKTISGSYWGEPEAGVLGDRVYVRSDTPVHSLLHETCHVVCMTPDRRQELKGDAGGDDIEECAVCYLQIVLADELAGAGRDRLMRDMDDWGYSFRLGSTRRWFEEDAEDAEAWLRAQGLLEARGCPTYQLRQS